MCFELKYPRSSLYQLRVSLAVYTQSAAARDSNVRNGVVVRAWPSPLMVDACDRDVKIEVDDQVNSTQ